VGSKEGACKRGDAIPVTAVEVVATGEVVWVAASLEGIGTEEASEPVVALGALIAAASDRVAIGEAVGLAAALGRLAIW